MKNLTSRFAGGLMAAMESEEEQAANSEVVSPELEAATDAVELTEVSDEASEVAEAGDGIEEVFSESTQATDDAQTLDSIADTLEEAEANGGADQVTAKVAEIAVEGIYRRLGIRSTASNSIPALESFGQRSTRQKATKAAFENIREQAKGVWAAVYKVLLEAKDWIVNFFKGIFDSNLRMRNYAEKLKGKIATVGELKDGAGKESEQKAIVQKLVVGNNAVNGASVVAALQAAIKVADGVFDGVMKSQEVFEGFDIANLVASKEGFKQFALKKSALVKNFPGLKKADFKVLGTAPEGTEFYSSGLLAGNNYLAVALPTTDLTGDAAAAAVSKIRFKLVQDGSQGASESIKPLSKEELTSVLDAVIANANRVVGLKQDADALTKAQDKLLAEVKRIAASAEANGAAKASASAKAILTTASNFFSRPTSAIVNIVTKSNSGAVAYAAWSLSQYEGGKTAAPAADKK